MSRSIIEAAFRVVATHRSWQDADPHESRAVLTITIRELETALRDAGLGRSLDEALDSAMADAKAVQP
jgi:hypothetical protein